MAARKRRALFVQQVLPVLRHRLGRPGHRLLRRMRVRTMKLRAFEEFFGAIVVKPFLTWLETGDDRVSRSRAMFRRMLIWRTVTTADVAALRASAKMQPPFALRQAFDAPRSAWLGRRIDAIPLRRHGFFSELLSRDYIVRKRPFIPGPTAGAGNLSAPGRVPERLNRIFYLLVALPWRPRLDAQP
jgi:hypothetical protein